MDRLASNLTRVVTRSTHRPITIEAANLAKFSDGSCTCSLGDTSVLVTVVSHEPKKTSAANFVPLTVDYRQKAAAAGRIPMTHLRRDIGFTEKEILTSRMIDRSIRSTFSKGFNFDTQIICNLLAVDGINDPDVLAINGASTSLALSDVPWNGPVAAVRMGLLGENPIVNPTRREQENSRLNLMLTANNLGNVMMMDGSCKEPLPIPEIMKAIKVGIRECREIISSINKLQKSIGKPKRVINIKSRPTEEHKNYAISLAQQQLKAILSNHSYDKISRDQAMFGIRDSTITSMKETFPEDDPSIFSETFNYVVRNTYKMILDDTKLRCDGRKLDQLRPINCGVDLYKPLHGSAIFQRGQTQVFCSTTFDSPDAAFRTDSMTTLLSGIKEKNFMLHYEFPPFATNDIGKIGVMPDRREIGHGALAERSIRPVIPENHEMTIRLNCEVLESNGSSSMASVSAGSLSLMDAGVKIKEPVAGIAMGLISDLGNQSHDAEVPEKRRSLDSSGFHLLTDILGFEDYIGDMDFKIAGTKNAITALQLDVKPLDGIPMTVLSAAIHKANTARNQIISIMDKVIREPRKELKDNHPVMKSIHIPAHKRAKFLGFGGANLKKMTSQIGVRISSIDIDELDQNEVLGAKREDNFIIFAPNKDAMRESEEFIEKLLEKEYQEPELEFNGVYTATITEIRPKGVMVSLYPNMIPTMLPLSQLDIRQVDHPSALNIEIGQQIQVKYFGRDPASGQMRLSRKSLLMSGTSRIHSPSATI